MERAPNQKEPGVCAKSVKPEPVEPSAPAGEPLFVTPRPRGRGRPPGWGQIDQHKMRSSIEYDLVLGVPLRVVAKKYNVSVTAAFHYKRKLPPQLRAANYTGALNNAADLEKFRITESNGLLASLAMQRARLLLCQDAALEQEDPEMVARLSGQVHKNIELTGRYLGEFAQHVVRTNVNVLIQPEYLTLRAKLVKALAPYGDARRAVAEVLHAIESDAVNQMQTPSSPASLVLEAQPNAA